ncbi:L-aspartate oxidase [Marinomonas gallaica]|uniref:L-aspartate oxidase n=1 Tax=Marinomonas gallaica TaxID=1806667 RepID=A0A1C3JNT9_9GAMM|nr:L-aspartate oxidase [Marinomonas gallaica]SBT16841.1 L-aspartate oxidase [Marinomonas gallaica]SBT20557.1 L-aspartate oxidase [Marinomonas gallaica]
MSKHLHHDIVIIGAGAAGLTLALELANEHKVAILTKGDISEGSTLYAQGGVAAVMSDKDTVDSHVQDTINAGAELGNEDAIRFTVENSKPSIDWLIDQGVPFTRNGESDDYHLTKEGGHSHRRIIHAADATGLAISQTLVKNALAHPNIHFYPDRVAIDLVTTQKLGLSEENRVIGLYALNQKEDTVEVFHAHRVALATGGSSKVYLYTSNPDTASGDGIAMAWRAGCRVGNMEFNQFHPTCLYDAKAKTFLISEAVRGEGGRLLLPDGTRFMFNFDDRGELAPRDIVARAIDHEMKRLGVKHVLLDISHKAPEFIKEHFPTIYKRCLNYGHDMTKGPIPVVPAAHYTCGGVVVDQHGTTDVTDLYAIGEASYTGLHGANRLASNSLLECIVYARSAAQKMLADNEPRADYQIPDWDSSKVTDSDEDVVITHNWHELRRFMWDYVGIVRTNKRLLRAKHRVDLLLSEIEEFYSNYRVSADLLELRNLAVVADLIIQSAMARKESRGLHFTLDYPDKHENSTPTILKPRIRSSELENPSACPHIA